jgi:hypothetical protein
MTRKPKTIGSGNINKEPACVGGLPIISFTSNIRYTGKKIRCRIPKINMSQAIKRFALYQISLLDKVLIVRKPHHLLGGIILNNIGIDSTVINIPGKHASTISTQPILSKIIIGFSKRLYQ